MVSSLMTVDLSEMNNLTLGKGLFFNYVDQFLPNFDHLPLSRGKLWTSMEFPRTTYPPYLVDVVIE